MVLKETLSYCRSNQSSDASKTFNRVQYCKLFRLLIRRGLSACIVRILAVAYYIRQARCGYYGQVLFPIISLGVKQRGVISPILFCVYIYDVALLAPTPSAIISSSQLVQ